MDGSPFASRFYSHDVMWEAREAFLRQHEAAMKRMADEIEAGAAKGPVFSARVELDKPIGEGLVRIGEVDNQGKPKKAGAPGTDDQGVKHFGNLKTACFKYRYENGEWYEITGYPEVKSAFLADVRSGPVIPLGG